MRVYALGSLCETALHHVVWHRYEVDIYEGRQWIGGKVASYVDKDGNHIEVGGRGEGGGWGPEGGRVPDWPHEATVWTHTERWPHIAKTDCMVRLGAGGVAQQKHFWCDSVEGAPRQGAAHSPSTWSAHQHPCNGPVLFGSVCIDSCSTF